MIKYSMILLTLAVLSIAGTAQPGNAWTLKFTKKNRDFKPGKDDYQPGKNGFYLYENGTYDLQLKNDMQYRGRLVAIKKDSCYFTTAVSAAAAAIMYLPFDTICIAPRSIRKIRLIGDRMMGLYGAVHLRNYKYDFIAADSSRCLRTDTITDTITTVRYLRFYHITMQGLDAYFLPYDTLDRTKIPARDSIQPVTANRDTPSHTRNYAWFLPLNAAKINGLATGLFTGNINGRPLTINGMNANIDLPVVYISMFTLFHIFDAAAVKMMPDSIAEEGNVTVNGSSFSMGGVINGRSLTGLSVNGGLCESNNAKGIHIAGGFTFFHRLKGMALSIRNAATYGHGIQLGLINSCKHLRGFQVGLWNVNGKRKLPFINWSS